jgi:formamidopyrimidine-DNA glycosylase
MPELPDVEIYVERLNALCAGAPLRRFAVFGPAVLATWTPRPSDLEGMTVRRFVRRAKRIVLEFVEGPVMAVHLMIAGRFHLKPVGAPPPRKNLQALFDFDAGRLVLTEASTKKRATIHLFETAAGLAGLDRGGLEPLTATRAEFAAALRRENHTVKRALTDPRLVSGIGNAHSDEILHRARLSPTALTRRMTDEQVGRLHEAMRASLIAWVERLRAEVGSRFPEKVTAFRPDMAVHGRFGKPCPDCGAPVQRIVYADNEMNYCARCQTGGKLLADRALSRLLRADWPKTLDDLEERTGP